MKKNFCIFFILFIFVFCNYNFSLVRWSVKTAVQMDTINIKSIEHFLSFDSLFAFDNLSFSLSNSYSNMPRLHDESELVSITGFLICYIIEADKDFHLVFQDTNSFRTIICEIPDSSFCSGTSYFYKKLFSDSRDSLFKIKFYRSGSSFVPRQKTLINLSGFLFHDFQHNTKFHAPHFLEVHPVIFIHILK